LQYNGAYDDIATPLSKFTGYKVYLTTACGAILHEKSVAIQAGSGAACCNPELYTESMTYSAAAKFVLIKAQTTAGVADAGVKIAILDIGASTAGVADAACTTGAGAVAFAALAVAALA